MKPNLPYSKALIGLAGWVGLLAMSHIGPDLLRVAHRDPVATPVVGNPGIEAVGILAPEAVILFVAAPILVTAILLYAYAAAHDATLEKEKKPDRKQAVATR